MTRKRTIDTNTASVGNIKTAAEAKRLCVAQFGKLPRCGYEMTVAKGNCGFPWGYSDYTTYLVNESGRFRVWTYISSS